ncbi:MAG: DUF4118 domain-containing protein [Coriobacteriia bacterium]|nr:DUF4118 domain-containing protein [Coriobacteriia bacterium]
MRSQFEKASSLIRRRGKFSAVLLVLAATVAFLPLRAYLDSRHWGWPYLLIVGTIAGTAGVGAAVVTAGLSFLAWNFFFIPPYHTLIVADPQDLVQLLVYLAVATAVGLQTGRLREREEVAQREERHAEALNRLSAGLVSGGSLSDIAALADSEVRSVLPESSSTVWVPGAEGKALCSASGVPPGDAPATVRDSFEGDVAYGLPEQPATGTPDAWPAVATASAGSVVIPLRSMRAVEGVLHVTVGSPDDLDLHEASFLVSTAYLLAAFLEARHLARVANAAVAAREAERLKTALVSSVSHELKTPLAAVTAAVTDILEPDVTFVEENVRTRLVGVSGDLRRLDAAIADLLDASRLEAHAWAPRREVYEIGEIVGDVLSRLPDKQRVRITLAIPTGLPTVNVDFVQVSKALGHVVDNAVRYSDGTVEIGAKAASSESVECWITDSGAGIPVADRARVFEKFFRGAAGRTSKSSTGLGLAITRDLLEANGGTIAIDSTGPHGTRMLISLPTGKV